MTGSTVGDSVGASFGPGEVGDGKLGEYEGDVGELGSGAWKTCAGDAATSGTGLRSTMAIGEATVEVRAMVDMTELCGADGPPQPRGYPQPGQEQLDRGAWRYPGSWSGGCERALWRTDRLESGRRGREHLLNSGDRRSEPTEP